MSRREKSEWVRADSILNKYKTYTVLRHGLSSRKQWKKWIKVPPGLVYY